MTISFDELFAMRIQLQDYTSDEYTIIKRLKLMLHDTGMGIEEIDEYLVDFYNSFGITVELDFIKEISILNISNLFNFSFPLNNLVQPLNTINEENNEENNNNDDNENNDGNNTEDNESENVEQPVQNNLQSSFSFQIPLNSMSNIENLENIISNQNMLPQEFNIFTNMISNILNQYQNVNQQNQQEQNDFEEDIAVTLDDSCLDELPVSIVGNEKYDRCTICLMDIEKDDKIIKLKCSHYFHKDCITDYLKEFDYKCPVCREEVGKSKAHINSN